MRHSYIPENIICRIRNFYRRVRKIPPPREIFWLDGSLPWFSLDLRGKIVSRQTNREKNRQTNIKKIDRQADRPTNRHSNALSRRKDKKNEYKYLVYLSSVTIAISFTGFPSPGPVRLQNNFLISKNENNFFRKAGVKQSTHNFKCVFYKFNLINTIYFHYCYYFFKQKE